MQKFDKDIEATLRVLRKTQNKSLNDERLAKIFVQAIREFDGVTKDGRLYYVSDYDKDQSNDIPGKQTPRNHKK